MRKRYGLLVFPIALIAVTTMSVTGQEEPLPVVTPRVSVAAAAPAPVQYIALAVEPIRPFATPTLADAARRHDYVTFHALYTEAKAAGENVASFEALHELWTWSMSDPIGAFYGAEMHARLSRAYPGFARYIEDHRIVDSRGGVFYPTSETRRFLLERAVEGRAPRVVIAETQRTPEATTRRATTPDAAPANPAPRTTRVAATPSVSSTRVARVTPVETAPVNAPKVTKAAVAPAATPSVAPATPIVAAPQRTEVPAAAATVPSVATTDATPVNAAPIVSAPAPVAPAAPVQAESQTPATVAVPDASQPIAREGGLANRGILLLLIGIVGVGLLAVMLRTPQETSMPSILQPPAAPPAEKSAPKAADATNPVAPVEPLRRPAKGDAKRAS